MTWQVILRSYRPSLVYTPNHIRVVLLCRATYKAYIVWSMYLVTKVTTMLAQALDSQEVFAVLKQNFLNR